jgi:hypothetical protein
MHSNYEQDESRVERKWKIIKILKENKRCACKWMGVEHKIQPQENHFNLLTIYRSRRDTTKKIKKEHIGGMYRP